MPPVYKVEISPTGFRSLEELRNKKTLPEVGKAIDGLTRAPNQQGKALVAPLEGVRSLRVARERFRILFQVDTRRHIVSVLLVAERAPGRDADVYALAKKLLDTFERKRET